MENEQFVQENDTFLCDSNILNLSSLYVHYFYGWTQDKNLQICAENKFKICQRPLFVM